MTSSYPRRAADADAALLSLLYESVGKPEGWNSFIDALAQTYRGGIGVLLIHDTGIRSGFAQAAGQIDPGLLSEYNQYYASINPWIPHLDKRPLGLVAPAEFSLPRADLLGTEFYADFLRPLRVGSGVGLTLQKDGSRHMVVSVLFPEVTAELDPDPVGRLQRLAPHLLRVAQLNRQLAGMEARAVAAETLLDRLEAAMFLVNGAARVLHMNTVAERIAMAADGLTLVRTALDAAYSADGQLLRELIASAARGCRDIAVSPGGVMRVNRRSGRMPFEVLVAPMSDTTLGPGFHGPLAAVFVRDPELRTVTPLDWLRRLYALTGAEARLLQSLLAGDTLAMIAERNGVTKETLRSQIKAIFLKTGTASQIELIQLGWRGIAAFGK